MILIEVDSDEAADKLAAKFATLSTARVAGIFQVPRTRCKCPDDMTGRHRGKLSSRGVRFKWWVHRGCGKVSGGNLSPIGNLLPASERRATPNAPTILVDSINGHDLGFYSDDPRHI